MLVDNIPGGYGGQSAPTYSQLLLTPDMIGYGYSVSIPNSPVIIVTNYTAYTYSLTPSTLSQTNVFQQIVRPGKTVKIIGPPVFNKIQVTLLSGLPSDSTAVMQPDSGVVGFPGHTDTGTLSIITSSSLLDIAEYQEPESEPNTALFYPIIVPITLTIDAWGIFGPSGSYFKGATFYNNTDVPMSVNLMANKDDTSPPALTVPSYSIMECDGMYYGVMLPSGSGLQYFYTTLTAIRP